MTTVRIYKSTRFDHRLIGTYRRKHGRSRRHGKRLRVVERTYVTAEYRDGGIPVKGKIRDGWQQVGRDKRSAA